MKLFSSSASRWMEEKLFNVAAGDLSMNLSSKGNRHGLIAAFKKAISSLKGMIRVVHQSSQYLHVKMEDMSLQSVVIAEQVGGVTSTVREIAIGMQDTSETIYLMAEDMNRIHHVIQDLGQSNRGVVQDAHLFSEKVTAGKKDIVSSKEQMQRISGNSSSIYEGMQQLNLTIKQITGIVKQIKEISNQTQLLALNANIEAARAGEQGKGFAVVASEISKLAVQTQQATSTINDQIISVTSNAQGLKEGIDKMRDAVSSGVETMDASVREYDDMTLFLDRILSQMNEMEGRFETMMKDSFSVSDSLNQTSAMIEEVAAGCQEVLASTEIQQQHILRMNDSMQETTQKSLSLRSVISQFKLPDLKDSHPLQQEIDDWMAGALAMRAIMVAMIDSRDIAKIRYWNQQKVLKELEISACFEKLERKSVTHRDRDYYHALSKSWQAFSVVRDQNARWMLETQYDKAKNGLVNQGRERFKHAMDVVNEWMEQEKE
ncbi:methyl-accepting chemotaxis protein [Paenibacillus sp. HWE-109]|uniref:methyl-accepting chemotaxis protein n=1 Tax=Paenibacillus sp. HWE-109 TaxID=1306526 RepID=UPI001EDDAC96|nr:methyl-accepting chemotaxis protein [Paenibacillus sp. HWE-109]UKS24468.1 methyl-accepting chemotaxis protein [Paenibacillus sp. HWE-109]